MVLDELKIVDLKCTSLETLSLRPESDFRPKICLTNCDKLIKNQGYGDLLSTMLRRYIINQGLQNLQNKTYPFHFEIPGSEIPKWFSHQNVGGSVNLQVPSDLSGNKSMGIAVCAVYVFRQHQPLHQLHFEDYGFMIVTHNIRCSVDRYIRTEIILSEEFGKIESYQLWVEYFPCTHSGAKEILNKVDANGISQIEVKFEPEGPGLEVTKCGAHLVFERDIEDLINQTKAGPSSCIITPYDEDGFEDSEKETKIKRSSDDSDGEGAGPSGEATSNDIDVPHPKSVQLPNLIQRLMLCLGNWIGSLCAQRQGDSDCEEEEFQ
nr:disease resistance-like protein csa1 [Quercus suber]